MHTHKWECSGISAGGTYTYTCRSCGEVMTKHPNENSIVYCEDCRWCNDGWCRLNGFEVLNKWFCGDGWKKGK